MPARRTKTKRKTPRTVARAKRAAVPRRRAPARRGAPPARLPRRLSVRGRPKAATGTAAVAAGVAAGRHLCFATDVLGGRCQNLPRPGTALCTIHTPNPVS